MTRRCPLLPAVTTAASLTLALACWPLASRADVVQDYTLTTTTGLADPGPDAQHTTLSGPQIIANVVPPGGVIAPPVLDSSGKAEVDSSGNPVLGSPMSILPDSHGFDQSSLLVSLAPPGPPASDGQLLGITFFNGGLAKDGVLHFSLDINGAFSTPPALQLISPTSGVTITADPSTPASSTSTGSGTTSTSSSSSSSSDTPTTNTPEPLSLLLWSTVAGAALWRSRKSRNAPARATNPVGPSPDPLPR